MAKVGRNDPCHCGSGKKYKKCCMAKDQAPRKISAKVISSGSNLFASRLMSSGAAHQEAAEQARQRKAEEAAQEKAQENAQDDQNA